MIVLGIDPGSRVTGYGVVDASKRLAGYIASGCIRTEAGEFPDRLAEIYRGVVEVIETYQPELLAIEQVFVAKNPASALKLGQARGVAIAAAVGQSLPVHEYAPRQIKQAVVGTGSADKAQVQHMVTAILRLEGVPSTDAADALAIALCHINTAAHSNGMRTP